jgi:ribosomal subunit interface protein
MRIDVRHTNIPLSGALETHIERKVERAVRRFTERIAAVDVRLLDENGPRGGLDKRCRVVVELVGGRQIVASGLAEDAYDAVSRAAARLSRQVRRTVSRGKDISRDADLGVSPSA